MSGFRGSRDRKGRNQAGRRRGEGVTCKTRTKSNRRNAMNGKRVILAGNLFSSAMALVATGADLSGPLAYTPIAPCRFADTRKTGPAYPCPYGAPALMAGEYRSLPVEGPIAGGAGVFASGEPGVVGSGSMVGVSGQAFGYGVEAQGNSAPLH